jgi:hypothetical protein
MLSTADSAHLAVTAATLSSAAAEEDVPVAQLHDASGAGNSLSQHSCQQQQKQQQGKLEAVDCHLQFPSSACAGSVIGSLSKASGGLSLTGEQSIGGWSSSSHGNR